MARWSSSLWMFSSLFSSCVLFDIREPSQLLSGHGGFVAFQSCSSCVSTFLLNSWLWTDFALRLGCRFLRCVGRWNTKKGHWNFTVATCSYELVILTMVPSCSSCDACCVNTGVCLQWLCPLPWVTGLYCLNVTCNTFCTVCTTE